MSGSGCSAVQAMRSRPTGAPTSSRNGRSGAASHHASPFAYPCITSSSAAASATVRAIGPFVAFQLWGPGAPETRPRDGLMPKTPHHADGMRIEPPPSEPWATEPKPAATAAPAPPDEPPGVRVRSHGLRAVGYAGVSVVEREPNSGVFVFPTITNPARRMRATTSSSQSGTRSFQVAVPCVVRMPAVSLRSLIEIGTPRNGGRSPPPRRRASASRAATARLIGRDRQERVELRVEPLDARECRLDQLCGRHVTAPDARGLLERGREGEVIRHGHLLTPEALTPT